MGQQIELTSSDGFKLGAYRADPAGKARGGIVLVQEIFGVNQHIRKVADGYAADGYQVIAPSFFDRSHKGMEVGYTQADIEVGRAASQKVNWDVTLKDVEAALAALKGAGKSAIIGYCWGGTLAWLSACRVSGLSAAVAYYGGGIPNFMTEKPKCPTMAHWGEKDHAIPMDAVRKFEAAHPEVKSFVYPAGHGFNCDERGSFDEGSAKQARERTLEFLRQHVG